MMKWEFVNAQRDAEVECEFIDPEMQRVLEMQLDAKEVSASILKMFARDTVAHADMVSRNVKELTSRATEGWLVSIAALESSRMELGIASYFLRKVEGRMNEPLDTPAEDDRTEKAILRKRREIITEKLANLLVLVRLKEMTKGVYNLLPELVQEGISPDKLSINAVLRLFCTVGFTNVAIELYKSRLELCAAGKFGQMSKLVDMALHGNIMPTTGVWSKYVHAYVLKNGYEISAILSTAFIDMNDKCGEVRAARAIFDSMVEKDTMSWTAMIYGYAQVKNLGETFSFFVQMKKSMFVPNQITTVFHLSLCAEAGARDLGKWLHSLMAKMGIRVDLVLATALMDMYVQCGDVEATHFIFSRTENRDLYI